MQNNPLDLQLVTSSQTHILQFKLLRGTVEQSERNENNQMCDHQNEMSVIKKLMQINNLIMCCDIKTHLLYHAHFGVLELMEEDGLSIQSWKTKCNQCCLGSFIG